MSTIPPRRILIQNEETGYAASVSEATFSRVGAVSNFISLRQYDTRGFFLNGPYSIMGIQSGVDGAWGVLFDVEIIAVMMFNLNAGSSGTTTLDVIRLTSSGVSAGSIFSTLPSIPATSGNNAYVFRDYSSAETLEQASGATLPVLQGGGTYNLNAGDMVVLNKMSSQAGGENCGLLLYYRPR